jgi:hypothetical protein
MMCKQLKGLGFGLTASRLGAAGFLLACSLLCSSVPLFSLHSSAPEAPTLPESNPAPAGATLTERLTQALQMWVDWYKTSYLPWSETDKQWKAELATSWQSLIDSLQKSEAEKMVLRLENEALKMQLAQAKTDRWIFGAVGLGVGAGVVLLIK